MSASPTDWPAFFFETFHAINEQLAVVLNASSCREGWLQGEFYRAGNAFGLQVNSFSLGGGKKVDLSCGSKPDMLAEIKITSAYDRGMRPRIESDVGRMQATAAGKRFMILLIRRFAEPDPNTAYVRWLDSCSFSGQFSERKWPEFCVKVWEI